MLCGRRAPQSAHETFAIARRDMLEAFAAWLRENPGAEDVADEQDGTLSAMDQMHRLVNHG
jgi:hypothetical protein